MNCIFTLLASTMVFFGATHIGNQTYPSLSISGTADLNGTSITEKLQVNGDLRAQGVTMGSAVICGNSLLKGCVIQEDLSVNGMTKMKKSKLKTAHIQGLAMIKESSISGHLALTCDLSTLVDTQVQNIVVHPIDRSSNPEQVLEIKGNSEVNGDIVFESGHGIIRLDRKAKIHGKVKGAIVEHA